jgi:hypothetical protein
MTLEDYVTKRNFWLPNMLLFSMMLSLCFVMLYSGFGLNKV